MKLTDENLDYPDCRPVKELADFGDSLPAWMRAPAAKRAEKPAQHAPEPGSTEPQER